MTQLNKMLHLFSHTDNNKNKYNFLLTEQSNNIPNKNNNNNEYNNNNEKLYTTHK